MIKYFDEVNAEHVEENNSKEETRLRMRAKVNSHLDHTLTWPTAGRTQLSGFCCCCLLGACSFVYVKIIFQRK
jgi:hypothetical protein